jgi:hypothetical protein
MSGMSLPSPWLALRRELWSISIHPLTKAALGRALLAVGTEIRDGLEIVRRADAQQLEAVTVLIQDIAGWSGFARVKTAALRLAFES